MREINEQRVPAEKCKNSDMRAVCGVGKRLFAEDISDVNADEKYKCVRQQRKIIRGLKARAVQSERKQKRRFGQRSRERYPAGE